MDKPGSSECIFTFFPCKMCKKHAVTSYMGVKENIHVKNNLKIQKWFIFHSNANFNRRYLKINLCDLLPDLLECIMFIIMTNNL